MRAQKTKAPSASSCRVDEWRVKQLQSRVHRRMAIDALFCTPHRGMFWAWGPKCTVLFWCLFLPCGFNCIVPTALFCGRFGACSSKSVRAPHARRLEPAPQAHWGPQGTPDRSIRTKSIRRASRTRTRFNRSVLPRQFDVNLLGPGHEAAMARAARRRSVSIKPAWPA